MPESSTTYSARISPDVRLRTVVLVSGLILGATGLVVIVTLPFAALWRGIAGFFWAFGCVAECRNLVRGFAACRGLRIGSDGAIAVLDADGRWVSASLLAGSLLLDRAGWLRLETESGDVIRELVSGETRQSEQWRRFQVIWRHIGA